MLSSTLVDDVFSTCCPKQQVWLNMVSSQLMYIPVMMIGHDRDDDYDDKK